MFYEDEEGIMWCLIDDGLYRFNGHAAINVSNYLFQAYNHSGGLKEGTQFLIGSKYIWYGSRKGLYKIDLKKKISKTIILDDPLHPPNWRNYILELKSINNIIYVGTSNGLYLVDKESNTVLKKYLTNGVDIRHRNSSHAVESFYVDLLKNEIWVAMPDGFYKINTKNDRIEQYQIQDAPYKYPHNFHNLIPYGDTFLIPTHGLGMVVFDKKTNSFTRIETKTQEEYSRAQNVIRSAIPLNDSISLVNVVELGNALYNRFSKKYTWLATPKPMKDGVFLNLDRSGFVWASKRGRIFRSIKPVKAVDQKYKHIIDVSSFVANNTLKSRPSIDGYANIQLDKDEKNIVLEYSVSKPYILDTIRYEYRLNSNNWISAETPNVLKLFNLPSGNKELHIRALDRDGNELASRKIQFSIFQPFYSSVYFMGTCIGLLLIAIYLLGRYSMHLKTVKKLQELDVAKSDFYANISHEFRTPLTLISGPIQQQLSKDDLDATERSHLEMAQKNSKRLLSLVDQLLYISKLQTGNLKLKISQQAVIPFVGSLVDGFTYTANEKEITYLKYNTETQVETWFDKDVLEKIIVNLLSNAVKYTPKNGSIVSNTIVQNNQLLFEIRNTGKGLTETQKKKIFERFYQTNENVEGVGIGLALVKELVQLHKGKITVESTPNEWTVFTVLLPIHKSIYKENEFEIEMDASSKSVINYDNDSIEEKPIVSEISNEELPILLIVDDNKDIRAYVESIFSSEYSILKATNGVEGIYLGIKHIPDLIISDVMMPEKNGIELCNVLKNDERTNHIPIILLTAKAGEENELEGIKTGADVYITKPFKEEILKEQVSTQIRIRKTLQLRYSQEVILRPKDITITSTDEQFLAKLQSILDEKLVESTFSIEEFSNTLGMSRMQLHRKLKALTGMSASEFIRSQRLKLAADLLKKSEVNISQIGYSVGFNDHAYFSKCFKQMFGCTPSEYSKKQ